VPTTTIPISTAVRDRLKLHGSMGMTYNDVITQLLDNVDRDKFLDEIRHRANTSKNWVKLEDLDEYLDEA
jgi:hypothetical protein